MIHYTLNIVNFFYIIKAKNYQETVKYFVSFLLHLNAKIQILSLVSIRRWILSSSLSISYKDNPQSVLRSITYSKCSKSVCDAEILVIPSPMISFLICESNTGLILSPIDPP